MGGPGQCLQPAHGDRLAAFHTNPEGPVVEPLDRGVDERELLCRPIAEREVALLLEDLARGRRLRAVRHLAGRLDLLAELRDQPRPLGVERGANSDRIELIHPRTVPVERSLARPVLYSPGVRTEDAGMAIEIDPVCGMEVDTATSLLSFEYDGKTYWFCGKGCLLEFKDDPEKYLDPDYQASM